MVAVPDATAALETHTTVTKVVEQALHLLQNLANADANRVRPWWCDAPTGRTRLSYPGVRLPCVAAPVFVTVQGRLATACDPSPHTWAQLFMSCAPLPHAHYPRFYFAVPVQVPLMTAFNFECML